MASTQESGWLEAYPHSQLRQEIAREEQALLARGVDESTRLYGLLKLAQDQSKRSDAS
jgi:hypothetical protein